jgi:hypothetical protein
MYTITTSEYTNITYYVTNGYSETTYTLIKNC